NQDAWREEVGVRPRPGYAAFGRTSYSEQIHPDVVDAHRTVRCRATHQFGGITYIPRVADVAFRQCDVDILETFGSNSNGGQVRLAWRWRRHRCDGGFVGPCRLSAIPITGAPGHNYHE